MSDTPETGSKRPGSGPGGRADALASRALAVVAGRGPKAADRVDANMVAALRRASLSGDRAAFAEVIEMMTEQGLTCEDIADLYIPEVARDLGGQWIDDSLSFAEVSIGTSRLQSLLRDLGPHWRADGPQRNDGPGVLVVVPRNCHHTLGAMVLSGQLRRRGYTVRLTLDTATTDLHAILSRSRFDAVFVSLAAGGPLDSVRQLVDAVRTGSRTRPPIVIGGGATDVDRAGRERLLSQTGADFATSELDEALRLCGLTIRIREADARIAPGI